MNENRASTPCEQVTEQMSHVLDGSASSLLLDHIATCDGCRDARYDAEHGELLMSEAGSDFNLPEGLAARLLALPATSDEEPAPITERMPHTQSAPEPPATTPPAAKPSKVGVPQPVIAFGKRWGVPVLAAAAAAAILIGRGAPGGTSADDLELSGPPWRGKIQKLLTRDGKLEICAPNGSTCKTAREGDEVPAGSQLRSDRTTLTELAFSDGSSLSLDRDTILRLSTRGRGGELVKGGVVADVEHQENSGVRFTFKGGHVDVLGTKFSLRSDEDSAAVHVARGQVRLSDGKGRDTLVLAGEEGRVFPGSPR